MSMGYGVFGNLCARDGEVAIYNYGCFNLNEDQYKNPEKIADGILTISLSAFAEPEIHAKIKRISGRKKIVRKKIIKSVDVSALIEAGKIQIENSKFMWQLCGEYDLMALKLLGWLFDDYQKQEKLPEELFYFW